MPDLDKILDAALGDGLDVPITADDTNRALYAREGYAWALDAFWAYEHLGERLTKQKVGTAARWAMYQYARKESDKFLGTILPRAMQLLEKAREKEGDDQQVVEAERKGLTELRRILKEALAEVQGMNPDG